MLLRQLQAATRQICLKHDSASARGVELQLLRSCASGGVDNDGSSKFRFLVTPIRIVCANTQTAAIEAASASWGIRHTGGARAAIQEARTTLKLSWRYMQAFEEEAAQLYSQAMDIDQMISARHSA
jgi:Domain of unknown function (DUF932)